MTDVSVKILAAPLAPLKTPADMHARQDRPQPDLSRRPLASAPPPTLRSDFVGSSYFRRELICSTNFSLIDRSAVS